MRDHDAADDGGMNFCGEVVGEKMGASGVTPAPVKRRAEKYDVEPVDEERDAVVDELGEQRCSERCEGDGAEEGNVNPREVAVGAGELVELRLLADPEDAVRHDAHQKYDETGREHDQGMPEVMLGMNGFAGGDAEVKHEKGHGYGEDAVAEGSETLDIFSCNAVVERVHQRESIGLSGSEQNLAMGRLGAREKHRNRPASKSAKYYEETKAAKNGRGEDLVDGRLRVRQTRFYYSGVHMVGDFVRERAGTR